MTYFYLGIRGDLPYPNLGLILAANIENFWTLQKDVKRVDLVYLGMPKCKNSLLHQRWSLHYLSKRKAELLRYKCEIHLNHLGGKNVKLLLDFTWYVKITMLFFPKPDEIHNTEFYIYRNRTFCIWALVFWLKTIKVIKITYRLFLEILKYFGSCFNNVKTLDFSQELEISNRSPSVLP